MCSNYFGFNLFIFCACPCHLRDAIHLSFMKAHFEVLWFEGRLLLPAVACFPIACFSPLSRHTKASKGQLEMEKVKWKPFLVSDFTSLAFVGLSFLLSHRESLCIYIIISSWADAAWRNLGLLASRPYRLDAVRQVQVCAYTLCCETDVCCLTRSAPVDSSCFKMHSGLFQGRSSSPGNHILWERAEHWSASARL